MTGQKKLWTANGGPDVAEIPFGFSELLDVVRRHASLIAKIAVPTVAATLLLVLLLPAHYSATAVVMLEPRTNTVMDASSVLSPVPTDPASVQNQIAILTSRDLAGRVVATLHLADDPEFAAPASPWGTGERNTAKDRDAVIDKFLRALAVDARGLSTTIGIRFTSDNAEKSAKIANAIADAYVSSQMDAQTNASRSTTQWLLDRIQRLAVQVQGSEAAVQRYKAEHGINDAGADGSVVDQQLAAINTALIQARADLAEKTAMQSRVNALVRSGQAADVTQVVDSPLITQLRAQETDLIRQEAELSTRYGPKHPKMIEVRSQKKNLDAKIAEEVRRVVETVSNAVAVVSAKVSSLEAGLRDIEHHADEQNMARVKLKSLEANAASTQSMYQAFVSRLRQTQDAGAGPSSGARIISRAAIPVSADGPRKSLVIAASIPVGLLLGLLIALFAERHPKRVPRKHETVPVFARLPIPAGTARPGDIVVEQPDAPYTKSIQQMLQRLVPAWGGSRRVVLVTSADLRGTGTDLAISLARCAAKAGARVVLIDGNLRDCHLTRSVGAVPQRGMLAALTGRLPLSQCFFRDTRSAALMLACSQALRDPARILGSAIMSKLIAYLRGVSDLVVIDAAPLEAGEDAALLARLSDVVLVVTRQSGQETIATRSLAGTDARIVRYT